MGPAQFQGDIPIYVGGPVEKGRGFVVHSSDQMLPDSLIGDDLAVSFQTSVINEIACGTGPLRHRIMLGYAGWEAGQLEDELREGVWFHIPQILRLFSTQKSNIFGKVVFYPKRI